MDSKLRAKVFTMAVATLGLSLVGACGKKAEATEPEGGEAAAGAEHSCGGANSCGAHAEGEGTDPAGATMPEGEASDAPAEEQAAE